MKKELDSPKVWWRFSKTINGEKVDFRWEQLPDSRYEEFIDFMMEYYVKRELTHVISGIYLNPKALGEYRSILFASFKDPAYHTAICCIDDESNRMIGFHSMKIYKSGDVYKDTMEAETAEVQKFYDILHRWNNLCPVPDILVQYVVDSYLDDAGLAIHPDYCGYGLTAEMSLVRYKVSKEYGMPLTGGWMTSLAVQRSATKQGWETIYEISSEELGNILEINFPKPQTFVYKIKKCI